MRWLFGFLIPDLRLESGAGTRLIAILWPTSPRSVVVRPCSQFSPRALSTASSATPLRVQIVVNVLMTTCEGCQEAKYGSVYATERRSQEEESRQDALRGSGQADGAAEKAERRLRRCSEFLLCFRLCL